MGRNKKNRVGEVFVSKESLGAYEFIITEYNNCNDVWVEFYDEHGAKTHTTYNACQDGNVKNPYHPSVHGHGYLGLMSDGSKPKVSENGKATREYNVWRNMIQRVYDPKYHEKQPTYKGSILEDCLHCFAFFLEFVIRDIPNYEYWLTHPNEGVALDKDIRGKSSKVYSRDTIMFVTQSENSKEKNNRCGTPIKPTRIYGVDIKTGERTRVFDSIREAERELGVNQSNICSCLNGKQKTTGGYKWYKVE